MKYPRTSHLPYSPGATSDDKIMQDSDCFRNKVVVVTEKLDGENCTFTNAGLYARSVSSTGGKLRERCKALWAAKRFLIPDGYRICGENMQWRHSISYNNLISPFYIFSVWKGDTCLSWSDTLQFSEILGIPTVPILFEGKFEEIPEFDLTNKEGFVVRLSSEFRDFPQSVAKYVRKNHVTTDQHWSKNLVENVICSKLTP